MGDLASTFGTAGMAAVLLLSARAAALLWLTPLFQSVPMPLPARLLLLLSLSAAIAAPIAHAQVVQPDDLAGLAGAFFSEVTTGATLGVGVLAAFAGFTLAGRLLDVQIGFGIAQAFDPLTRTPQSPLTSALGLVGVLVFLLANGHHLLLRGLSFSVDRVPLGRALVIEAGMAPVIQQLGALFALGFALAAPVALGLLLVEFALGILARNAPQANIFLLGLPVKIIAGLALLALWAPAMGHVALRLQSALEPGWARVLTVPANSVPRGR